MIFPLRFLLACTDELIICTVDENFVVVDVKVGKCANERILNVSGIAGTNKLSLFTSVSQHSLDVNMLELSDKRVLKESEIIHQENHRNEIKIVGTEIILPWDESTRMITLPDKRKIKTFNRFGGRHLAWITPRANDVWKHMFIQSTSSNAWLLEKYYVDNTNNINNINNTDVAKIIIDSRVDADYYVWSMRASHDGLVLFVLDFNEHASSGPPEVVIMDARTLKCVKLVLPETLSNYISSEIFILPSTKEDVDIVRNIFSTINFHDPHNLGDYQLFYISSLVDIIISYLIYPSI